MANGRDENLEEASTKAESNQERGRENRLSGRDNTRGFALPKLTQRKEESPSYRGSVNSTATRLGMRARSHPL